MLVGTKNLLEKIQCKVVCIYEEQKLCFDSGAEALDKMADCKVISIYAENNTIVLQMKKNDVVPNDLNEDWVKEHEERYGEKVSFF